MLTGPWQEKSLLETLSTTTYAPSSRPTRGVEQLARDLHEARDLVLRA